MDYRAFYDEVTSWILNARLMAAKYGMDSSDFWAWVADSTSELSKKYQNNRLVIKQMMMLFEWLEEVHEARKGGAT